MKNRLMTLTTAALACCAPSAHAQQAVALFKSITGPVQVVRKDTTVPATAGMSLQVSDRVVSPAGASAGIAFHDGTRVAVGPSSELVVRDFVFSPKDAVYAFDVHLARGSALFTSGSLVKLAPAAVKVSTPSAMIGVRGTRFLLEAY